MPRRLPVAVLLAVLLAGCTPAGDPVDTDEIWEDPCPVLAVPQQEVVLDAGIGETAHALLEVRNDCDGVSLLVVDAVLDGDASLSILDDSVTVPPGGSGWFEFTYTAPDELGRYAVLTLEPHGLDPVGLSVTGLPRLDTADADGDGHDAPGAGGDDCDDDDPDTYPGAPELPDGKDNDCDGVIDEDAYRAGDLVITEIMIDPVAASDVLGEWVEVHNTLSREVDLLGWVLVDDGGQRVEIDRSVVVPAGGYAVLGVSEDPDRNGGVNVDYAWRNGMAFTNARDSVWLQIDGRTISGLAWEHDDDWQSGAAWGLDPRGTVWCYATSPLPGGDLGTPGALNDRCNDLSDDDGDGWTVGEGDCDDADPEVNPDGIETWGNRKDDDCNGLSDDIRIDDIASGYLDGDVSAAGNGDLLGWRDQLSVGDVDGDGAAEAVLGGWYLNDRRGGAWVVSGRRYSAWRGDAADVASAWLVGDQFDHADSEAGDNQLGAVGRRMADNTGDGTADLVVAGVGDYWFKLDPDKELPALLVFAGGGGVDGELDKDDAALALHLNFSGAENQVLSDADVDGDGIAEIVYGEAQARWQDADGNWSVSPGQVTVVQGGAYSGGLDVEDADTLWRGDAALDYLGHSLGGADLDGDGYDELIVSEQGDDTRRDNAGVVWVMPGSSRLDEGGNPRDDASARIYGATVGERLGRGVGARVGDLDGNGTADLVISSLRKDRVFVFFDAGDLSGTVVSTSATRLEADVAPWSFGVGLAIGDLDGDGVDDLAVGAAGNDEIPTGSGDPGAVYVWFADDWSATAMFPRNAGAAVLGLDARSGLGMGLLAADLDDDGVDELLISAPGASTRAGRVWAVSLD